MSKYVRKTEEKLKLSKRNDAKAIKKETTTIVLCPHLSAAEAAIKLPITVPILRTNKKEREDPIEYPLSIIIVGSHVPNPKIINNPQNEAIQNRRVDLRFDFDNNERLEFISFPKRCSTPC